MLVPVLVTPEGSDGAVHSHGSCAGFLVGDLGSQANQEGNELEKDDGPIPGVLHRGGIT